MTRKSRTIFGAAAMLVAATIALTGCSAGSAGSASSGSSVSYNPKQKVTLDITWWGSDQRTAIMNKVFASFEKKYPNITVVGQPVGDPTSEFNRLATDFASNTAPDIFALGGAEPQQLATQGSLLNVATVSKYLPLTNYPSFALSGGQVNGKQYSIPTGGNAVGMLINENIFKDAGVALPTGTWTWNDLINAANEISANEKSKGVVGMDLRIQDILGTYIAQLNKVGLYNDKGNLAVSQSQLESWFDIEKKLVKGGGMPDPSTVVANWNVTPNRSLFGEGKAAITFDYTNQMSAYTQGIPGQKVEIVAPPTDTKNSGVSVLPSQFWAINAKTKYPAQSALLVNYLLNNTDAAKIIGDDRGLQFNPAVLKVVKPLLDPTDAQGANYLEKVLKIGTVAPAQPAGGADQQTLSQRIESNILFNKESVAQGSKDWITQMNQDLKSSE